MQRNRRSTRSAWVLALLFISASGGALAERGLADAELTARLARYLDRAAEEGFTVEPGGLMVALRAANEPGPIKISLQVESGPPHRISGISVQLGN